LRAAVYLLISKYVLERGGICRSVLLKFVLKMWITQRY